MSSSTSSPIPRLHLLCIDESCQKAFDAACKEYHLPSSVEVISYDCSLASVPASTKFDLVVSPANSYGRLDGGFDDAISRAFAPKDDYMALTRVAQEALYRDYRGFAPPGTCTLVGIPDHFTQRSKNVWGTRYVGLCPTMRMPQDVKWDREVVYECIWSLLCAIDKHNREASQGTSNGSEIRSILMTPLATGAGFVSPKRWASQTVLAIKHFVDAGDNPSKWSALGWGEIRTHAKEVAKTWKP
jgi:O-acetyl-ADP-ribose deacetylase (regulator of RNase III)